MSAECTSALIPSYVPIANVGPLLPLPSQVPYDDWKKIQPVLHVNYKPNIPKQDPHDVIPSHVSSTELTDEDYIGGHPSVVHYEVPSGELVTVIGGLRWVQPHSLINMVTYIASQVVIVFDAGRPGPVAKWEVKESGHTVVSVV